jgi:rhodanese-related sulfurtransferase
MKKLAFVFSLITALAAFSPLQAVADVSPTDIPGATTVDAAQAKALFEKGVLFVDVRKDSDWDAGRIPGAEHIELKKVFGEAPLSEVVDKDQEVVFYCNGEKCMRSSKASEQAVAWGFTKVYYFRDGLPAWQAAGYPVE